MLIDFHCHYDKGADIAAFVNEAKRLKIQVCLSGLGPHYNQVENDAVEEAFR